MPSIPLPSLPNPAFRILYLLDYAFYLPNLDDALLTPSQLSVTPSPATHIALHPDTGAWTPEPLDLSTTMLRIHAIGRFTETGACRPLARRAEGGAANKGFVAAFCDLCRRASPGVGDAPGEETRRRRWRARRRGGAEGGEGGAAASARSTSAAWKMRIEAMCAAIARSGRCARCR